MHGDMAVHRRDHGWQATQTVQQWAVRRDFTYIDASRMPSSDFAPAFRLRIRTTPPGSRTTPDPKVYVGLGGERNEGGSLCRFRYHCVGISTQRAPRFGEEVERRSSGPATSGTCSDLGATRTEAAKIGGVGLQIVRDWVLRFNALGPDGLLARRGAVAAD